MSFSPTSYFPEEKRFNEVMAYVLSLYFWLLFLLDPRMRQDFIDAIFTRKTGSLFLEVPIDIFLILVATYLFLGTLSILVSPTSSEPNVRSVRQDIEFIVLLMNLLSGLALQIFLFNRESSLSQQCYIIMNGLIVVYGARLLLRDTEAGKDTATGEMHSFHVLCCLLFVVALILLTRYAYTPYWAESLSLACSAAVGFGYLLPTISPLQPLGSRLKHANSAIKGAYGNSVEDERRGAVNDETD